MANAEAWAPDVAADWQRRMDERGVYFWLGVDAVTGEIVGVAHADAAWEPDAPASLFLDTLYVLQRAQGSGLAAALLRFAIGEDAAAYLWVIEGNDRAIAFYERQGFRCDGVRRAIQPGWPGGVQVRMVRGSASDEELG